MGFVKNIEKYVKQDDFKIIVKENCINVQNYIELDKIESKEIILFANRKKITIVGSNLTINKLLNDELLVLGDYSKIIFEEV